MRTCRHQNFLRRRRARGFTLIEVLLAVAIFGMVVVAMHLVFFGALRLRNRTTAALEATVPLQQALAIMRRDLAGLVVPGGTLSGVLQTTLTANSATSAGTNDSAVSGLGSTSATIDLQGRVGPDLYTAVGILSEDRPWAEVQKVAYRLAESTNNTPGLDLFRVVTRNLLPTLTEDSEDQWLMGGVETVEFEFYDGTLWRDYWDSSTEETPLPAAIRVAIQLTDDSDARWQRDPIELVVPILVQGAATAAAEETSGGQP